MMNWLENVACAGLAIVWLYIAARVVTRAIIRSFQETEGSNG